VSPGSAKINWVWRSFSILPENREEIKKSVILAVFTE
jgi:hypothetical protein